MGAAHRPFNGIGFNDFLFPLMERFNHKLAGDTGYAPILSDSKSDLLLLQSIPSYIEDLYRLNFQLTGYGNKSRKILYYSKHTIFL